MSQENVKQAVEDAGGRRFVAERFDVSYEAVRRWELYGVPSRRLKGLADLSGWPVEKLLPDADRDAA